MKPDMSDQADRVFFGVVCCLLLVLSPVLLIILPFWCVGWVAEKVVDYFDKESQRHDYRRAYH